jgi:uncharacterized protein (DUF1800 family)
MIFTSIDPRWAWSPYVPTPEQPWNLRLAGHLYRRAAFGATWAELQQAVEQGPSKTIAMLLKGRSGQEDFAKKAGTMGQTIARGVEENQLRAWWLYVLLNSPHPLQEKLTLFWHNHFATSNAKVNNIAFMWQQNELMRRHALGSFRTMLQEMSKDPAMMLWLDTILSKRGQPNENYAREVMELFSLGRGNYTETDIREAARAFTGWEIKEEKYHFNRGQFDATPKTVFGKTGNFSGEDIVNLCLDKPACARFLVRKLFRYFISERLMPEPELLEPLAEKLRQHDYKIAVVVETMLRSNLFFSEHAYRNRIKSPVDFAIGTVHQLEGKVSTVNLALALDNLGQRLFAPPSVKGWDGGETWLNSTTLLLRQNLALALTSAEDNRFGRRCDPAHVVRKYHVAEDDEALVAFCTQLFLQDDLPDESRQRLLDYTKESRRRPYPPFWSQEDVVSHRYRALCYLVLTQPEYQLD